MYFLGKYNELSELVALNKKIRYFTEENGRKEGPHKNEFWVFLNSEMNFTNW